MTQYLTLHIVPSFILHQDIYNKTDIGERYAAQGETS